MNFTQQGQQYLNSFNQKLVQNNLKYDHTDNLIEGFSGAFGPTPTNTAINQQTADAQSISNTYNKALSNYGMAEKVLMEETAAYVNTMLDENTSTNYSNQLIQLKNGEIGYVTDKFLFKHVPSTDILDSIRGKNGCPSTVTPVNFTSDKYSDVGGTLGTNPDLFVGNSMSANQACAPTDINLQVLGATNPAENLASWKGCWTGTDKYFDKQKNLKNMANGDDAIAACQLRSADIGASGFYIGTSGNNSYDCFTAKPGTSMVDIQKNSQPAVTIKKSKSILSSDFSTSDKKSAAAGILNNGQVALGNLSNSSTNFGQDATVQKTWNVAPFDNCDPKYGVQIDVQSATYGANCNGSSLDQLLNN